MNEGKEYLQFNGLNNYPEVIHFFSKKPYNFNRNQKPMKTIENDLKELMTLFSINNYKLVVGKQTHSLNVVCVDEKNKNDIFENTDGLITNIKGIAIATFVADCQSILLYDSQKKVIGNIHSGWRGTLGSIITNAIMLMVDKYGCSLDDIKAFICPCIQKECFEVDEDVKDMFVKAFNNIPIMDYIERKNSKYLIDTVGINIFIMEKIGLKKENIYDSKICTKCRKDDFHSYRGDKKTNGRNISIIMLK